MIHWQWMAFEEINAALLYQILKLRQDVFVIEQNCIYPDIDEQDVNAWHLVGCEEGEDKAELVAYCRIMFPGKRFPEPAIGRVLTLSNTRGKGVGRLLMQKAVENTQKQYPNENIRISAQAHLEKFYQSFGFNVVSDLYDEDGIPHLEMLKTWEGAKDE